jgi:hypothetical protein
MLELSRTARNAVAGAAVGAFAAAFALLPTQAGSRLGPPAAPLRAAPHDAPALPRPIVPLRDPFVPRVDETPPVPARITALPPNAGAGPFPFAAVPAATHLLAVVTGPQPRALVDETGQTRLLSIGARLGAARITAIDADGVTLDDGRHLTLAADDGGRR